MYELHTFMELIHGLTFEKLYLPHSSRISFYSTDFFLFQCVAFYIYSVFLFLLLLLLLPQLFQDIVTTTFTLTCLHSFPQFPTVCNSVGAIYPGGSVSLLVIFYLPYCYA